MFAAPIPNIKSRSQIVNRTPCDESSVRLTEARKTQRFSQENPCRAIAAGWCLDFAEGLFSVVVQAVEVRAPNGKSGSVSKSGPKKLEDLEAEGKLAMDRLEDIANYMGDYRDIVDEYAVSKE